jgi:hypothetical protein
MATLETQYKNYLKNNPNSEWTYDEWLKWHSEQIANAIKQIQNGKDNTRI